MAADYYRFNKSKPCMPRNKPAALAVSGPFILTGEQRHKGAADDR
jgi:hypothetical protein